MTQTIPIVLADGSVVIIQIEHDTLEPTRALVRVTGVGVHVEVTLKNENV